MKMTNGHYLKQAQNGSYYCVDDLGMMCAGNWDTEAEWERHAAGRDKYDGGIKWAVVQNLDLLTGGEPLVVAMDNEGHARSTHVNWLNFAKERLPDNPECWPQLVSARVHWQVQG